MPPMGQLKDFSIEPRLLRPSEAQDGTHFRLTLMPSFISFAASLTVSEVILLRHPYISFLPFLSKTPQAQPFGMPSTGGS